MTHATPPHVRPRIDLWEFVDLITSAPPMTVATAVLPSSATLEEVEQHAEVIRRRPIAWAMGLDAHGAHALAVKVRMHAYSQRRK